MLKRQIFLRRFKGRDYKTVESSIDFPFSILDKNKTLSSVKKSYQQQAKKADLFVINNDEGIKHFRLEGIKITRIVLSNIGTISNADIQLISSESLNSDWLMLLGENATGKSTILKALTIALSGQKELNQYTLFNKGFYKSLFKQNSKSKYGYIKVYLEGQDKPREVRFYPSGKTEFINSLELSTILLAYGSTRLSLQGRPMNRQKFTSIQNLFDPFETLQVADDWLLKLDVKRFDYFSIPLKEVLNVDESARLEKLRNQCIVLITHGQKIPLIQLSDGFKSVITLFCDIASSMYSLGFETTEDCKGVVLIDELGVHLHPSWKIKIVKSLRSVFPFIQFICTTHDPLCLRGLQDGEVVVLNKSGRGKVTVDQKLPSVKSMRVDQLLTSKHFGLNSTIDPDVNELFSAYYDLLAKSNSLTDAQHNKLDELRSKLSSYGVLSGILGDTYRDQMMYKLIDKLIANKNDFVVNDEINADMKQQLSSIWNKIKDHKT